MHFDLTLYTEGREAFLRGEPEESSPYDEDSDEFVDWSIGWHEARLGMPSHVTKEIQ